jgi:hypothetical protein
MTYETFHQAVVLAYINHDGNPSAFFEEVVAALNQFREEKQAAQQSVQSDGAYWLCPKCEIPNVSVRQTCYVCDTPRR